MSTRRTLRVGPYGKNIGLKDFVESSYTASEQEREWTPNSPRTAKQFPMMSTLNTLNQSFMLNSSMTSQQDYRNGIADKNDLNRSQNGAKTANEQGKRQHNNMLLTTMNKTNHDKMHTFFNKKQQRIDQNDKSVLEEKNSIKDTSKDGQFPRLRKLSPRYQESSMKTTLLSEQNAMNKNLNNLRHLMKDMTIQQFASNLRYEDNSFFKTKRDHDNLPASPRSMSFRLSGEFNKYNIKTVRDFQLPFERPQELQFLIRKRLGAAPNQTQLNFDMHLRDYSLKGKDSSKMKNWIEPSPRNISFVENKEETKQKRFRCLTMDKINLENTSHLEFPKYDEKPLEKECNLIRTLRRDKLGRQYGDICAPTLRWQLSLNNYQNDKNLKKKKPQWKSFLQ